MALTPAPRRLAILTGTWIGAVSGLPVIALSFLAERLAGLPFVPFDLFDWLARVLPGDVLTAGIDALVSVVVWLNLGPTSSVAKTLEQMMALTLLLVLGSIYGTLLAALGRRTARRLPIYGLRGGLLLAAGLVLVEASLKGIGQEFAFHAIWLSVLSLGWGVALGILLRQAGPALNAEPGAAVTRRGFVALVGGGALGLSLGAWGLASLLDSEEAAPAPTVLDDSAVPPIPAADSPPAEVLAARPEPAPGTRPELTPNEAFYRIDINTRGPRLDGETWRLEIGGLVDNPLSLSLAELRAMPAVTQTITLSCISNRIGGDLIGTSQWTGVRLREVLERARIRPEGEELFIQSADGFFESVAMKDLQDDRTLLVYGMNGEPLPFEHGFPLRIYIPNRYGMKQPKWIQRMEVIDHEGPGYWVERGWSSEAIVNTTSVIDVVATEVLNQGEQVVPVGGIAYSGARGISKVEVQVDEGPWVEARLRTPPLSPLTWVQWRFDWPVVPGRHTFRVRAYDGGSVMQVLTPRGVRPDGATGVHELSISI